MENDIVKGIAKALRDTFGPGYRIYQNDIEQGFQTPCFFILPMKATPSPLGKDRFLLKSPFDVHFFPEDEKDNAVMQAIAWQLWQALEFITLPDGDGLKTIYVKMRDDVGNANQGIFAKKKYPAVPASIAKGNVQFFIRRRSIPVSTY